MLRAISWCSRVIWLRVIFEMRAISASSGSAYVPPRLTKPSFTLRDSASAKLHPKSFAIAVVIELPPMFSRRGKILPGSQKSKFVVRDPMSSRMVQPSTSG